MKFKLDKAVYGRCLQSVMAWDNPDRALTCQFSKFGPKQLAQSRLALSKVGLHVPQMLVSSTLWGHLIGSAEFFKCIEPSRTHAEVLNGKLGFIFGMEIWTDAYLPPDEQFIERDSLVLVSADQDREIGPCVFVKLHPKLKRGLRPMEFIGPGVMS